MLLSFKYIVMLENVFLYRWAYGRSHSKAIGCVLVMYTEGKGRKHNDIFAGSLVNITKSFFFDNWRNYVRGVKYIYRISISLTTLTYLWQVKQPWHTLFTLYVKRVGLQWLILYIC